jgi:hypothetical protein
MRGRWRWSRCWLHHNCIRLHAAQEGTDTALSDTCLRRSALFCGYSFLAFVDRGCLWFRESRLLLGVAATATIIDAVILDAVVVDTVVAATVSALSGIQEEKAAQISALAHATRWAIAFAVGSIAILGRPDKD